MGENVPAQVDPEHPPLVPGRACGTCTLCCKVMAIKELDKPQGRWCAHCAADRGCRIYGQRPRECRTFFCGYLAIQELTEEWRPSRSKIVLANESGGNRLVAHVDPGFPGAWRNEPFYSYLKTWARAAARVRAQVVVYVGMRVIVILPDADTDLGVVEDDELIAVHEIQTPTGLRREAFKVHKNDPRAAGLQLYDKS